MLDLLSWNFWVSSLPGGVHFGLALLCLMIGPVVFLRRKGTMLHRVLGTIYVVSMVVLNVSALTMRDINGGLTMFHFLAMVSLATVIPGFISIQIYRVRRSPGLLEFHRQMMIWSYFGLASAGVWQVSMHLVFKTIGFQYYNAVLVCLIALTLLAYFFINRMVRPRQAARS